MSVNTKRMIILIWLLISIAALITLLLGAWDYYHSVGHEVLGSAAMHSGDDMVGSNRLFVENYFNSLIKSIIYMVINIGVTVFAISNVK